TFVVVGVVAENAIVCSGYSGVFWLPCKHKCPIASSRPADVARPFVTDLRNFNAIYGSKSMDGDGTKSIEIVSLQSCTIPKLGKIFVEHILLAFHPKCDQLRARRISHCGHRTLCLGRYRYWRLAARNFDVDDFDCFHLICLFIKFCRVLRECQWRTNTVYGTDFFKICTEKVVRKFHRS